MWHHGVPWDLGGLKAKTREATGPKGLWPRELPRPSIHHDTPKAFLCNIILLASRTSKERFFSANALKWTA